MRGRSWAHSMRLGMRLGMWLGMWLDRERGVAARVPVGAGFWAWSGRFSVLLDRIDHLATAQGPLHRMFDTGNISIYTTGSPHVELVLRDLRGYAGWVDRIEPRLPSSRSRRAGAPGSPSGDAPPASDESPVIAKAEGQETPMSDGMGG